MKFVDFLKNQLSDPSPLEVVSKELAKAHLERLEAENAVEYSQACLDLALSRIERLTSRASEYKK